MIPVRKLGTSRIHATPSIGGVKTLCGLDIETDRSHVWIVMNEDQKVNCPRCCGVIDGLMMATAHRA